MLNKLKGLFSIDEFRVSAIVILLFIFSGFALWQFKTTGEISANMTTIIIYGFGSILGINGISSVSTSIATFLNNNKVTNINNTSVTTTTSTTTSENNYV